MFREMRRKKQLLSEEETSEIIKAHSAGVLSVTGDDGYPYGIPISYAYIDGNLYFHCAKEGHKIDAIKRNDKVSFCVIDKDEVIQETFTTHFRSVVAFGRARILTEDIDRRAALESLVGKYSPDYMQEGQKEIEKDWSRVCVVEVKIEHMTGKAAKEIAKYKE
ncbi:pyridoxamine 5'-phosphate oxidase [Desulfosporosinus acididurans]|uniref:Pyridoxamine 5'-phosphate oxidase n=1 Tax=Desulfosporosinus acididurans TaxID=476652 RepID=A0A0J1FKV1_9FIRM|nr:pyridoxamine 5'-phosphate oxidase family protein [Desulfosporosinus acididurans]KLU64124.1 pyridoxamine 5'-phosphate oxidase [Desulfosporosinus acididurans]